MYLNKKIVFASIICLFLNCKKEYEKNSRSQKYSEKELCIIIETLIKNDQKYRSHTIPSFNKIIDSIKNSRLSENSLSEYKLHSLAQDIFKKKKRKISKRKIDSLMKLQILLDNQNTEILIDIVKNIGFPTKENTECKRAPGFIFRHSQKQYWGEIRPLIKKEYEKGNIPKSHYDFLLDHINGREISNKLIIQK